MSKIIFSGAPCSGKTTLINNILNQKITPPFDINVGSVSAVNANTVRQSTEAINSETVLYHYDHMRPYKRQQSYDVINDPFLKHLKDISTREELIVVTLLPPLESLSARMTERISRLTISAELNDQRREKLQLMSYLYKNKTAFIKQTEKWLIFANELNIKNHYFYSHQPGFEMTFRPVNSLHQQLSFITEYYL